MKLAPPILAIFAEWAATALSAPLECPLIRPPSLSPTQVENVVLTDLAATTGTPIEQLKSSKSFVDLDRSSDRQMHFAFFVVRVGEDLGIDDAAAFFEFAKPRHRDMTQLTVQEYVDASRAAYAKGKDELPPLVKEGASYKLGRQAAVPVPSSGLWHLVACGHSKVAFQRADDDGGVSTAYVTTLSLPPFTELPAFKVYAADIAQAMQGRFGTFKSFEIETSQAPRPCADFRFEGGAIRFTARGRTCYRDASSSQGYGAYFMRTGPRSPDEILSEAGRFIDAALAAAH